ncbi:MAG TPA: signal peptidase I [Erysipelothrix sp.]
MNDVSLVSILKRIISILTTLFTVFLMVIVLVLILPRVFNIRPFAVVSGSMEPHIKVGSVVYAKKTQFDKIEPGDVITYVLNEDLMVATHRVIEKDSKEKTFITKGDANNTKDAKPVLFENVLGVVSFSIPFLGYIALFLQEKYFLIMLVLIYVSLFLVDKLLGDKDLG